MEKDQDQVTPRESVEVKCNRCEMTMIAVAPKGEFPKPCPLCGIGEVSPVASQGEAT